jgi:Fe-S cluster assembly protein SufD
MSRTLLINPTALEAGLLAAAQARATPARASALARFAATGLPHRRLESWKWTDLRAALRNVPEAEEGAVVGRSLFGGVDAFEITVMNGEAEWQGTPPEGVAISCVGNEAELPPATADHPLANLCAASVARRLEISVAAGAKVLRPIHLRHVGGAGVRHFWAQMRLEPGSEATLLESINGAGAYFSNTHLGVGLDESARLRRFVISDASPEGVDAALAGVRVGAGASFSQCALLLGGKASRFETRVFCLGAESRVDLASGILVDEARHADQTSLIYFGAPGCGATQLHKAAAHGRARAVFQGKFHVAREGQKTDAHMAARALLLNEGAEADHKPELEIYADDVKCGHGSAVGALDADALFYFQQRGLPPDAARVLLIEAFVGEVFDAIDDAGIAAGFRARAARWLERAA